MITTHPFGSERLVQILKTISQSKKKKKKEPRQEKTRQKYYFYCDKNTK